MFSVNNDGMQNKAAKVAGFSFLFAMVIVVLANYGISFRLSIPGNAVETARNITAHETLFRLNVACNLLYGATIGILLTAIYVILKPVNFILALIAAFFRSVVMVMWCITALNMLAALQLLSGKPYLNVFEVEQIQALVRHHLDAGYNAYYIGLPFWTIASTICSYLWFKSKYIPKGLAVFGIVSSLWCVFCAFVFLVYPDFQNTVHPMWFDSPMVIFEITLGFWLLFKRLRIPEAAQTIL